MLMHSEAAKDCKGACDIWLSRDGLGSIVSGYHGSTIQITFNHPGNYSLCVSTSPYPTNDGHFAYIAGVTVNVFYTSPPPPPSPSLPSVGARQRDLEAGLGSLGALAVLCLVFIAAVAWRRTRRQLTEILLQTNKIRSDGFDDLDMNVFLKDSDEPVELHGLMLGVLAVAAPSDDAKHELVSGKFVGEIGSLIVGEPQDAALGVMHYMKVDPSVVHLGIAQGLPAIEAEFERYRGEHAEEARECMHYVLYERAGSSLLTFQNGLVRDADRHGETLADFVAHPDARTAKLSEAHVAALRIYTTAAYRVLNEPLRDLERTEPHPFPVTIAFLREAIGKLRAVGAQEDTAEAADGWTTRRETRLDLWRGLRDTEVTEAFSQNGGTELAPMSTTTSLEVAVQYAAGAKSALIFKLRTDSFMQRGASIGFLSAFPTEEEVLYPPLTYLKPTGKTRTVAGKGRLFTVVEVVPQFGG